MTIIHVLFRNLNWTIFNIAVNYFLNQDKSFNILLIDNNKFFRRVLNHFTIIILKIILPKRIVLTYKISPLNIRKTKGSLNAGLALNFGLDLVDSQFSAIVDPDFAILEKNWIKKVERILESGRIDIIGSPHISKKESINSFNNYKSYYPQVWHMVARTKTLQSYSLQPDLDVKYDTGYMISKACFENKLNYFSSIGTYSKNSNYNFLKHFGCVLYKWQENDKDIIGIHFGRGSNPFGKNRNDINIATRILRIFLDPVIWRCYVMLLMVKQDKSILFSKN